MEEINFFEKTTGFDQELVPRQLTKHESELLNLILNKPCAKNNSKSNHAKYFPSAHHYSGSDNKVRKYNTQRSINSTLINLANHIVKMEKSYYVLAEKIGEGGFCDVYLSYQLFRDKKNCYFLSNKKYAIKLIDRKQDFLFGGAALSRFVDQEVKLTKMIYSKTVGLVCKKRDKGVIVTHYLEGIELIDFVNDILKKEEGLMFHECLTIALAVVEKLYFIHCMGVIHRDIKPENIKLDLKKDDEGSILSADAEVFDFNLSTSEIKSNTCCGTPSFSSPEIFKQSFYTQKTDVWSFMCVLFILFNLYLEKLFHQKNIKIRKGFYYQLNHDEVTYTWWKRRISSKMMLYEDFLEKNNYLLLLQFLFEKMAKPDRERPDVGYVWRYLLAIDSIYKYEKFINNKFYNKKEVINFWQFLLGNIIESQDNDYFKYHILINKFDELIALLTEKKENSALLRILDEKYHNICSYRYTKTEDILNIIDEIIKEINVKTGVIAKRNKRAITQGEESTHNLVERKKWDNRINKIKINLASTMSCYEDDVNSAFAKFKELKDCYQNLSNTQTVNDLPPVYLRKLNSFANTSSKDLTVIMDNKKKMLKLADCAEKEAELIALLENNKSYKPLAPLCAYFIRGCHKEMRKDECNIGIIIDAYSANINFLKNQNQENFKTCLAFNKKLPGKTTTTKFIIGATLALVGGTLLLGAIAFCFPPLAIMKALIVAPLLEKALVILATPVAITSATASPYFFTKHGLAKRHSQFVNAANKLPSTTAPSA